MKENVILNFSSNVLLDKRKIQWNNSRHMMFLKMTIFSPKHASVAVSTQQLNIYESCVSKADTNEYAYATRTGYHPDDPDASQSRRNLDLVTGR
jgi:hypothetical protein